MQRSAPVKSSYEYMEDDDMERLIPAGNVPFAKAGNIAFSRLGIGFEKLDRDVFDLEKAYEKVSEIGVKKIRLQSGWMKTERQEGVYDFSWLDAIVDKLLSLHMEPWLNLSYGNPLYTDVARVTFGAVGCPPIGTQREMQAWLNYVKAAVTHFKGRIRLYEIWNEPDLGYSWKHFDGENLAERDTRRNALEYGEFARETALVIKAADENAEVAAFAMSRIANLEYVNNALSTGLADVIDYVSFHVYSSTDNKRARMIQSLLSIVRQWNPRIRVFQGESGVQSRSDGHGAMKRFSWTPEKQTKMLLRTMLCDLHADIAFTSYFSTMDMIEALNGRVGDKASYMDYGYFGVISAEFDEDGRATGAYTKKPSYYALSTLASLLQGDSCAADIPYAVETLPSIRVNGSDFDDSTLQIYPFRLHDGRTMLAYWNGTDILTTTYEGTCSLCVYGQKNENILLCDLRDGKLYQLPEGMLEDLGNGGVRLRNIPLLDAPLAILFG